MEHPLPGSPSPFLRPPRGPEGWWPLLGAASLVELLDDEDNWQQSQGGKPNPSCPWRTAGMRSWSLGS